MTQVARAAPATPTRERPALDLARDTYAIVLAGGRGSRLGRLTERDAKPAIPFGGQFRIIDFTLSNCHNSGIRHIGVATQYRSQGLFRHLRRSWSFLDGRSGEGLELLPAHQRSGAHWYRGTADAVYQNLEIIAGSGARLVLVLAGDHIYKMDYTEMLREHLDSSAHMTVGCIEVPRAEAREMGVMEVAESLDVLGFEEKPSAPRCVPGRDERALASMGIYVFDAPFLHEQLLRDAQDDDSRHDFGGDVIPYLLREGYRVHAHRFRGVGTERDGSPYWRDVGTLDAYWQANLDLTREPCALDLHDAAWPLRNEPPHAPPAKVLAGARRGAEVVNALLAGGCVVRGARVHDSLLSNDVCVEEGACLEQCVMLPGGEVGPDAALKRVVLDRDVRVPAGLRAGFDHAEDRRRFHVTPQGVVLITQDMLQTRDAARDVGPRGTGAHHAPAHD
ncbi:MAG: glucose-1-phosphate adenylyltransferase [Gammaproteobacteria bacterium]|nr:glucose-1-phosphate adenylyltransferase [Gammaproteobacteria bacterium]